MNSITRALLTGSLPLIVIFGARMASAATSNFCTFTDISPLQLNGHAAQAGAGNTLLRLTPNLANRVGSAFLKAPVPFPAGTSFHTYFRAQFSPTMAGADGISFILQNSNAAANALGANGSSIGYGGVVPSVAVEFDTFQNGWDPSANHIGVMKNGDIMNHVAVASPPFALTNMQGFSTWIDFDGATNQLRVFASLGTVKPAAPLLTTVVDIAALLGGTAYAGFTSGTSAISNDHDILEWGFSTDGVPCKCGQDAACGGATPVCSATKDICVQCSATNQSACTGQTSLCDVSSGACVNCLNNASCGGDTPICNLATKTCAPCASDADCVSFPGTPACALQGPKQGRCVVCATDAHCDGATPKCDPATNLCVGCVTNADCGGITPICEPNMHVCYPCLSDADCGGITPACQPSGECGQCSATNSSACVPPTHLCDIPTGTCVSCASNQDCSGNTPVCYLVSHTCGPCTKNGDCVGNPDGPACSLSGVNKGECVPCVSDSTCKAPTPKCDVPSNECVECISNTNCAGMTPACNTTTHTCVGCVESSTCAGGKPVCDPASETCVGCQSDYMPQNPPPLSCPTPAKPACETMGPLAGHCVQCDATNTTACPLEKPVCIPVEDVCGCINDTDCPVAQYCDTSMVPTGACAPGCRVVNGMDRCDPGKMCSKQDGSIGMCQPTGTSSAGPGSGGMGGLGPSGSNGSGEGGFGNGTIGEGGGCSCNVVGEEGDGGLALLAGALGLMASGRRRRRR